DGVEAYAPWRAHRSTATRTPHPAVECSRVASTRRRAAMTTDAEPIRLSGWALVLGSSSGFGAATSLALARAGMNIFGVHLDRKSTLPNAERVVSDIKGLGRQAHFYNINAADEEKRAEATGDMKRILPDRNGLGRARAPLPAPPCGT